MPLFTELWRKQVSKRLSSDQSCLRPNRKLTFEGSHYPAEVAGRTVTRRQLARPGPCAHGHGTETAKRARSTRARPISASKIDL